MMVLVLVISLDCCEDWVNTSAWQRMLVIFALHSDEHESLRLSFLGICASPQNCCLKCLGEPFETVFVN